MNRFLIILLCGILLSGCAGRPAPPKLPGAQPYGTGTSRGVTTSDGKPPLPSDRNRPRKPTTVKIDDKPSDVLSPSEIFSQLSPAVFKIYTATDYQSFQGSGFFISSDGIAISNYHVFQGTIIGYESIILDDGTAYKVSKVYHKSSEDDVIIFKVAVDRPMKYVKIAYNTPQIGEKIYTIGSPRGLDNTFSSGEISQIRDDGRILQISAPIDHGSSGGVLLNSRGEAVGITSAGLDNSGANLNFAMNINVVKPYIP